MMTKGEAFEKFGNRIKEAETKLGQAYRDYYKERDKAEKELQKVLGEINDQKGTDKGRNVDVIGSVGSSPEKETSAPSLN